MLVALITIVLVLAGGWLLYREPPKQRPGQALNKFDRTAQRVHELIQGRWYGKVAATVVLLFAGLLVAQLFSSEPLTASTKTVTVTVPGGTTVSTSTHTETTKPEPKPTHSVIGSWTGLAVDQDDTSTKYQIDLLVQTTKIDTAVAGTLTEKSLGGNKCEYLITATGKKGNAYTFSVRVDDGEQCYEEKFSVERKADDTLTFKSDFGIDFYVGVTPPDGMGTLRPS